MLCRSLSQQWRAFAAYSQRLLTFFQEQNNRDAAAVNRIDQRDQMQHECLHFLTLRRCAAVSCIRAAIACLSDGNACAAAGRVNRNEVNGQIRFSVLICTVLDYVSEATKRRSDEAKRKTHACFARECLWLSSAIRFC
jgi:hypothetical protein